MSEDRGRSWVTAGQPLSRRYPPVQVTVNPMAPQDLVVMNRWDGLYEREFVNRTAYLPLIGAADDDLGGGQVDPDISGAWVQSPRLEPDGAARVAVQPRQLVMGLGNVQYWAGTEVGAEGHAVAVVLALDGQKVYCADFPYLERPIPMLPFPGQQEEYALSFIAPAETGRYNLTASVITGAPGARNTLCPTDDDWQSALPPNATRTVGQVVVQE